MNYQEENELLLAQDALPNLYLYENAVPGEVKHAVYCCGCSNNCLIHTETIKPIFNPDLHENTF